MHFHFHDRDDLAGCTQDHRDQPVLNTLLATLDRMEMNLVSALQDQIDTLAAAFGAALDGISAEIDSLKAGSAQSADLSGLEAKLVQAQALVPAPAPAAPADVPAPVEQPAPAVDPAPAEVPAPAAVDPGPVDITVPAAS